MRIIATVAGETLPFASLHSGARPATYTLLAAGDRDLASDLHDHGWHGTGRRPWSLRPPLELAAGQPTGQLELASPDRHIADTFHRGLICSPHILWAGHLLDVVHVDVVDTVAAPIFHSITPVVVNGPPPRRAPISPDEALFEPWLEMSLRCAAAFAIHFGCDPHLHVAGIVAGPKLLVVSDSGRRRVAASWAAVEVDGDQKLLETLGELGLGARSTEGFGYLPTVSITPDNHDAAHSKELVR